MKVREIMTGFVKVQASQKVTEAAKIMDREVSSSVLVEKNGLIAGIMTERDIVRKLIAKEKNPGLVTVEEIMTLPILTIDVDADVLEASRKMAQHRIRHLVVVDEGKIVGKITAELISKGYKYALARDMAEYSRANYSRPRM